LAVGLGVPSDAAVVAEAGGMVFGRSHFGRDDEAMSGVPLGAIAAYMPARWGEGSLLVKETPVWVCIYRQQWP
jgi:hypothetical protein